MKTLSILLGRIFTIQSRQLKEVTSFRSAFLSSILTDTWWLEDRQGQGKVFLVAVRKRQVNSVLVLILECKFSVIPTLKQQQPLSHLEIMGAVILQKQQIMMAKRRCSEEAISVLQRTLHLPYLRNLPLLWMRGTSPSLLSENQRDW